MTTFQELEQQFTVKNGIIRNPGKFEGETLATPFYYEIMLDGEGAVIEIEPSDRLDFDIDDKYNYVYVYEDSMGFVNLFLCETRAKAESFDNDNVEDYQIFYNPINILPNGASGKILSWYYKKSFTRKGKVHND